ncbi:MAG: SulP family inorganic anion transporter [Bacteroidota bacterium]|nr:SulP family inorganic anion transporter [Bacteroidota bacterium]
MLNNKLMQTPKDGFAGLKENFASEAVSGFMVFLLALPLSIGIAKASDFPPIFGLVTAIIGGIIVSFFSGSKITIKGPAAGLIVIASGAVSTFGGGEKGWHITLAAIVVAGLLQVVFGVLKFGKLSDLFPGAAIHGMLAAIGIIIMSKQIHTLLGIPPSELNGKEPLELLAMIPQSLLHENAHVTEIGIACLLILIAMSYVKNQKIKKIPAPLIVLAVAIPLGFALHIKTEGSIANFALVKVGSIAAEFKNGFVNVDFSGISGNIGTFIEYVVLFSLIGSIESLLTVKAMDNLDRYERKSDANKDLWAIGIGNVLSGIVGGLPMISEVARSSANIEYGAKTRWSNFFHGLFLLLAVLLAVPLIEMIPNTALAAMLIFVGFRLAHPKAFKHMYHIGIDQLIIFCVTIFMTLATDLLIGVGSGMFLEIIINMFHGARFKNMFRAKCNIINGEHEVNVIIHSELVFSNFLGLKNKLNELPEGKKIMIHLTDSKVIDHSSLVALGEFEKNYERKNGKVILIGLGEHTKVSHHPQSTVKKKNKMVIQE